MENVSQISTEVVQEVVTDALRRHVGRTKAFSVAQIATETTIAEKTVYAILEGNHLPAYAALLKIAAVLPTSFMSEILSPAGLGGVEHIKAGEVNAPGCLAELSKSCAEMADRLKDGKFCHRDQAAMAPQLIQLARKLEEQGRAMSEPKVAVIR